MTAVRRFDAAIAVVLRGLELPGHLTVPEGARGVVLVVPDPSAHVDDAQDRDLANRLAGAGLGVLSVDLFAADERDGGEDEREPDVDLLAVRVLAVTRWLRAQPATRDHSIGYFGASGGADVALMAAAEDPTVAALVTRDARLEILSSRLSAVRAATLLVVDGGDGVAIARNEDAARRLRSEHALVVLPATADRSDGQRALDSVADRSVAWFARHLVPDPDPASRRGTQLP